MDTEATTPRLTAQDNPPPGRGNGMVAGRDAVFIRLPAVSAYLSILRTAVAGLAARLDFTLDEIEDLRIAIDEACAMLLGRAIPGTDLECEFELTDQAMDITVTAVTIDGRLPGQHTFSWAVLTALAGHVETAAGDDGRVTIRLFKQRGLGS
jgi:serine/threonine-protein kinase RsbW